MTHIWNIYEPADPNNPGDDPFDIFLYSLRREEAPQLNALIYVEGKRCRAIAIAIDHSRNDVNAFDGECYYKVAVTNG